MNATPLVLGCMICLSAPAPAQSESTQSETSRPFVHWTFDDGRALGRDGSGNGHDLTIPGSAATLPGVTNLDGSSSPDRSIRFAAHDPNGEATNYGGTPFGPNCSTRGMRYPGRAGFTVSFWAFPAAATTPLVQDYWEHRASGETFSLRFDSDAHRFQFAVRHGFTEQTIAECTRTTGPRFVHVVGVYEPKGPQIKLYVNGVRQDVKQMPGPMRTEIAPRIYVCGSWHATNPGRVDDVRLFDVALTDEQVRDLYAATPMGPASSPPRDDPEPPQSGGRDLTQELHAAVVSGDAERVRVLLQGGADGSYGGEGSLGRSALHEASHWPQLESVRVLLEMGADVDAQDDDGATPLHLAAARGQPDVVALLLQYGADKNAKDKHRRTPLYMARGFSSAGHIRVRELLQ